MTTIKDLVKSVRVGETSATQLIEKAYEKIEATKDYNIFINLTRERAFKRASAIDQAIASGQTVGRLAGVPFALKDNFVSFGAPTTAASKILENYVSPIQATTVEKLEAEGAICVGKTNLDAFAHGGSTENSAFGVTLNAYDKTRVAGGSSGGSAVAVALDIVPFALGSDTGGSIRQPASFNGVYGIKPTYGMVSRYGVIAMASSTDSIGCFTRNTQDMQLILDVIGGQDKKDMTTLADYFKPLEPKPDHKYKIGVISETLSDGVDQDTKLAIQDFTKKLQKAGHEVETVSIPMVEYALSIYYIVTPAELTSNLARFDGVRYGMRDKSAKDIAGLISKSRSNGFEIENKRRILIGNYVLSSGFFDAYYLKAQKARTLLINQFASALEKVDFLISPTTPSPAFKIGENTADPLKMYLADIMTVPASLAGLPAINLPLSTSSALPIGLQVIGKLKSDSELLQFSRLLEESHAL